MIYTIGHTKNYMEAISAYGQISKKAGGYAFLIPEDAQRRIEEEGKAQEWSIFGLDAAWSQTQPDPEGGWWSLLTEDALIIPLPNLPSNP
jgi:hypothetical protein